MVAAAPASPATAFLRSDAARAAGLGLGAVALAGCVLASLALGTRDIPLHDVLSALTASDDSDAHVIVSELRVPRTEIGLLAGAALGAAGTLVQGVTRNPLAEPGTLGVNAGAAFAVVLAIFVLGIASIDAYLWFAFAGAAVTIVLVYALGTSGRDGATPIKLALAGAVLSALFLALTSAILVLDTQTLDRFRFWVVGSLAGRDAGDAATVAPFVAAGLCVALAAGRHLNALALGEDVARSLGQRVVLARIGCGAGFVLLAGAAVAAAGPIAFVGLVVPHIVRSIVGTDYRWIVPYSAVGGAILLLASDVVGRVVTRPVELEVGIVTAALGAPLFVALVRRRKLPAL